MVNGEALKDLSGSLSTPGTADTYWARIKMLGCLAEAYIQETGLPASKICLVQEIKDGKTLFYYRPIGKQASGG